MISLRSLVIMLALLSASIIAQSAAPTAAQSVRVFEYSRGHSPIAVLFVHGLGGCAVPNDQKAVQWCPGKEDSFRYAPDRPSWPQIIASDQREIARGALQDILGSMKLRVSDLGVWGVDYSRLTTYPCAAFSIPELARAVRAQIEASDLFFRYEQVIVVAHSMGGLITKEMMLDWAAGDDRSRDQYLNRVAAVMMLGVPSQGSPLATNEGLTAFFRQTLNLDSVAKVCDRQVADLFPGDANTFLVDLERRWEKMVGDRRGRNSQAPLRFCAYEKTAEPVVGIVVPLQYAFTQCDDSQFPLAVPHTQLPKPTGPGDDVHSAWFYNSLGKLFARWATWTTVTYDFGGPSLTLAKFADFINSVQQAVRVELNDVGSFEPVRGRYMGPDAFGLAISTVVKSPDLCVDARWPDGQVGVLTIRKKGKCSS